MEEKRLNEQESLALIASMIRNTQHRMERNAGGPFLIWGYTTVAGAVGIALLVQFTGSYQWQWLWFLLPAIAWPLTIKDTFGKGKEVVTFVDKVIGYVWLVCGIAGFAISALSIVINLGTSYRLSLPVFLCINLLMGMGTAMTGLILKFKPCIWGGFAAMALAFLYPFLSGVSGFYVFAAVFVVMMIIPGHLLNARAKKLNNV